MEDTIACSGLEDFQKRIIEFFFSRHRLLSLPNYQILPEYDF